MGARLRTNYLGAVDLTEFGVAWPTERRAGGLGATPAHQPVQLWWRVENPAFGGRPRIGWRFRSALLDGVAKTDVGYRRERTTGAQSLSVAATLTYANVIDTSFIDALWSNRRSVDLDLHIRSDRAFANGDRWLDEARFVFGYDTTGYAKAEVAVGGTHPVSDRTQLAARVFAGIEYDAPWQRALYLSAADPLATFENHWWRPAGALLKRPGVHWLPLGGPALRGYQWDVASKFAIATNLEASRLVAESSTASHALALRLVAFADVGTLETFFENVFADAGVGANVRGRIFDRDVVVRLDAPFYVSQPSFGIDRARRSGQPFAARWVVTFNDIW